MVGPDAADFVKCPCDCGKHREAQNDDELYGQVREHVDRDPPEMGLSDEHVAGLVAEGAYDK